MKKKCIVEINNSTVGSTGRIMFMIADDARKHGFEVYTCSAVHGNEKKIDAQNHIYIGNKLDKKIHLILAKKTGYNGCFSQITTAHFLKKLDKIHPDLIHFHNLHNCYINLPNLFGYIKKKNIPVVWTLHDCWPYTGHCAYYDFEHCNKWTTGCHDCTQTAKYPYSDVDRSKEMYEKKKKWFTGANITLVSPSKWLGDEVKKSFLAGYPVRVINNGIDLDVFHYTKSDFRETYHIKNKFVILGVASSWAPRKGLDVFLKLANELPEEYQIVIVGVDEKEKDNMPYNVIAITRTSGQEELAEIYSSADVFVNPTREENFPTTNIEALACGTGVITYRTGGSPEIIDMETGIVVEKDDYEELKKAIIGVRKNQNFKRDKCRSRAMNFKKNAKYEEYIDLFNDILNGVDK